MRIPVLLFAALSLEATLAGQEHEKKVQRADLPAPVEKTVAEQSQGATIKSFSQEEENGETYYEAEMMVSGHTRDVLIDKSEPLSKWKSKLRWTPCPPQ